MRFVIHGVPTTKKNSSRIFRNRKTGAPFIMASKQSMTWAKNAELQLRLWRTTALLQSPPIKTPVNVRALVYRARKTGDLNNYLAAIADVLEAAGVVVNDRLIEGWDGSRMLHDKDRPRVEIEIVDLGFIDRDGVADVETRGK